MLEACVPKPVCLQDTKAMNLIYHISTPECFHVQEHQAERAPADRGADPGAGGLCAVFLQRLITFIPSDRNTLTRGHTGAPS